jgi:DNA-binding NtrC family response regulator
MKKPSIHILGMEEVFQQDLKRKLFQHGFAVFDASDVSDIFNTAQSIMPDLVIICSTKEFSGDGLKEIEAFRRRQAKLPIILITKFSSESRAIAALKAGANDYFKLPFSNKAILDSVKRLLSDRSFKHSFESETRAECTITDESFIGKSGPMKDVKSFLLKVAKADSTVLITGETGTGKELAAEYIHSKSPRYNNPFICVNCAALPENLVESELFGYERGAFTGAYAFKKGKFELAKGGTLFLDEIGDMTPFAQAKILRSIESKEFFHLGGKRSIRMRARVVAATNQDPERLIAEGRFRKDLYYRLNVARVDLPALRERKGDLPFLIQHAIQKLNHQFCREIEGLTDEALVSLLRYNWPGNVRELLNLLEVAYINLPNRKLTYIDLPKPIQKQLKESETIPQQERKQIISALMETNWNKSTAAKKLNWSRMTLYRKIAKYNIVENRSADRKIKHNITYH